MEKIIFVNGKYHSAFTIFNLASFKESFCANNGLELDEVSIFSTPTQEQMALLLSHSGEGTSILYKEGKACILDKETITFELNLEPV